MHSASRPISKPTCQQASLDARAEEAALPSRLQHAARLGALAMLVPDLNGCPCCTNPPSYFVTDAATCLLGNPLAHAVRHRVALYGRDTTVWLRAEDRLILGAIPSTPALSCRAQVQHGAARDMYHSLPPSH